MAEAAERVTSLLDDLFPICRSITGPGTRATLDRIARELPIRRDRVASGTKVLDWTVPDEWAIRDAFIARAGSDVRLVDFATSNLHVVSYSEPVHATLSLDELRPHLFSLPDRPSVIPYRTSYYARGWGFCLPHEQLHALEPGDYDVLIDSSLKPGSVEWGELVIPGESGSEVLLTTHICHPSLANDNLSGIAALIEIGRRLLARENRHTFRLLFIPGTIGSISWLATHRDVIADVVGGLVLTGVGDSSPFTYKASRRGNGEVDRLAALLVNESSGGRVVPFSPYGYDERQFCSPGFDLPVGRLTRGVHGEYAEYHTSADDLGFVSVAQILAAADLVIALLDALGRNRVYRNLQPYGEPQLGSRGLYSPTGGGIDSRAIEMAYLWVLNGSDSTNDLCSIAETSGLPFHVVAAAADRLAAAGLLAPAA
jgi:aminopeptidase-like protein